MIQSAERLGFIREHMLESNLTHWIKVDGIEIKGTQTKTVYYFWQTQVRLCFGRSLIVYTHWKTSVCYSLHVYGCLSARQPDGVLV